MEYLGLLNLHASQEDMVQPLCFLKQVILQCTRMHNVKSATWKEVNLLDDLIIMNHQDEAHVYNSWGSEKDRFENVGLCIGIDLGTTNSCVGMWHVERNHVKILKNKTTRGRTTPSVVSFNSQDDSFVVGTPAIEKEQANASNTIRHIKRLMGQKNHSKAVEIARKFSPYTIKSSQNDTNSKACVEVVRMNKKVLVEPEEISAIILKELKESAENYFPKDISGPIENAVITVPAYFNDSQRKATIKSAKMAGFKAIRLLNEPTAAAMAYGLFVAGQKQVIVFDFGGGTLDVSLMKIDEGKFEVIGIGGDTNLGGEDLTHVIMDHIVELLYQHFDGFQATKKLKPNQLALIRQQVEEAKILLSTQEKAQIQFTRQDFFFLKEKQEDMVKDFTYVLTRTKFQQLGDGIFKRCLGVIKNVLKEADVLPAQVDEVIMVGGSTRIPYLRSKISDLFDGKELCLSVHADEVVCEGAAIQAAILSGMDHKIFRDVLMMDVIPLSIGLEKANGEMEVLLPKNARLPVSMTKYFETFEDFQQGVTISVYEGEELLNAKANEHICDFHFRIPATKMGKKGEFLHPVTFTMNSSGVLQVEAGIHHHQEEEAPMSTRGVVILGLYLIALVVLYVIFRIYFADDRFNRVTTTISSTIDRMKQDL